MRQIVLVSTFLAVALIATAAPAVVTNFSYTQANSATGSGTISGFVYNDGGGNITFAPTAMPSAVVVNPNPGLTPAGFIGAQTAQAGASNEGNVMVGLTWTGSVTATGTRGANVYTMQIPLIFIPKQTQSPDVSDFNWNVTFGDSLANGADSVGTNVRMMMLFGRDPVVDATETPATFQRYTQQNMTFAAGVQDTFTNTHTSSTAIKDSEDPAGAPTGSDAANLPLAFYFGWRDFSATGSSFTGRVLIDDMTVGGLINADQTTLRLVPEPSTFALAAFAMASAGYCGWRRRRK